MLLLRRVFAGLAFATLSIEASAGEVYQFAWSHVRGEKAIYVSETPVKLESSDTGQYQEQMKRWKRALMRQNLDPADMSATHVGTPGGIEYNSRDDAEDARLRFIQRERKSGSNVEELSW